MPKTLAWTLRLMIAPTDVSPTCTNVVVFIVVCGFSRDCSTHLSNKHQGTLKNKTYYSQVLEGTRLAQGPCTHVTLRSEWKETQTRSFVFIRAQGLGIYRFESSLFIGEFKIQSWNEGVGREKWSHSSDAFSRLLRAF